MSAEEEQADRVVGSGKRLRSPKEMIRRPKSLVKRQRATQLLRAMKAVVLKTTDGVAQEVVSGLYIGSLGAALQKEALEAQGITHILGVVDQVRPMYPESFEYAMVEVRDAPHVDLRARFDECHAFIDRGLAGGQGGVLVHCFAGRSRSATVVLSYLVGKLGYGLADARARLDAVRPGCAPNSGFQCQLEAYAAALQGEEAETVAYGKRWCVVEPTLCRVDGGAAVEYSVHWVTGSLLRDLKSVFPDLKDEKGVCVVPVLLEASCELTEWTEEANADKDRLLEVFMDDIAAPVAAWLHERGQWADYTDPCSGHPVRSARGPSIYTDVEGTLALLRYQHVGTTGPCPLLSHPRWGCRVYPATVFSLAPPEMVAEAMAQVLSPLGVSL